MITLPLSATHTANIERPGGETSRDTLTDAVPPGFLALLGNHLLSRTQQGADDTRNGVPDTRLAGQIDEPSTSNISLSDLLAALNQPEQLNALLQRTKDTKNSPIPAESVMLSSSDLQALQTLYTMLSGHIAPLTSTKLADSSTDIPPEKYSPQHLLSTTAADHTRGAKQNGLLLSAGKPNQTMNSPAAGLGQQNTNVSSATDLQQIISNSSKEIDNQNPGSAPDNKISHHVFSTASALLTPAVTSTVTAPATPQLNAQLGSPEWQQALGQQILMFSRNGQHTAELHLHPQDLGSIQVRLKLDNDLAQLHMVSHHSQVRAALEAALPQLRVALAESGIMLGQSNVSSDAFQQGHAFSRQQEQRDNHGNPFSFTTENDSDATSIDVPANLQARAAGDGAVDIFA